MSPSDRSFAWLCIIAVAVACSSSSGDGEGGSSGASGAAGSTNAPDAGSGAAAGSSGSAGSGAVGEASTCTPPTPEGRCDTFPQCGCDEGSKCDVLDPTTGLTGCVMDGTGQAFEACSSFQPCAAGGVCIGGACKPYCDADADCPEPGQRCVEVTANVSGQDVVVPGHRVCRAGCDPRQPELVCGPDVGCAFLNDGTTDCVAAGTGVGDGACPRGRPDCAPGYQCLDDGTSRDCVAWCRVGNPNDCAPGELCVPLLTSRTFDGQRYGACQPEPMLPFP